MASVYFTDKKNRDMLRCYMQRKHWIKNHDEAWSASDPLTRTGHIVAGPDPEKFHRDVDAALAALN